MPVKLIAIFISLILSAATEAQARTVDITLTDPRVAQVSGFAGDEATALSAPGYLYKLEFGERSDRPCFLRAHFHTFEDDSAQATRSVTFDRCRAPARSLREIEVTAGITGYDGIDRLSVCNNRWDNRRLKGETILGTGTFLRDLDDDVVKAPADIPFSRPHCRREDDPSACGKGEVATGVEVQHNDDEITGLALICSTVTAAPHSVTVGDFTQYPLEFRTRHWPALEGQHPMLRVTPGQAIETRICAEDFPPGSPAEAQALRALAQVASVQNDTVTFDTRTEPCIDDERDIFDAQALDVDVQIQIVDWGCPRVPGATFQPFGATGGVCYLNEGETEPWRVGDCGGWGDCWADAAVVMLRASHFPNANRIPSVGVIAHELGHMFGQLHNYDDADNACSGAVATHNYRKPKLFHLLPSFAKGHGTGRNFEAPGFGAPNADRRAQSPTAYAVAYMQFRYPRLPLAVNWPSVKEWAMHQTVTDRDEACTLPTAMSGTKPVTFSSEKSVYDIVPERLCRSASAPFLVDCATLALPVFRVQFSSNDDQNCDGQQATLAVVADQEVVYEQPIPLPAGCRLAYYNWRSEIRIPVAAGPPQPRRIDIVVNRGTRLQELDPDNNSVSFDIPVDPL